MALQKVLLMGKSGAGKTSMRSIIFANYLARDTMRLGATIDVEHSHVRFLGNLVLNLWDCGGQEAFMENYFELQRDHIFRNVQVLIYVFDIESRELAKDMEYYASCLQALKQNSKSAKVFCLVHKMDLIPEEQREEVFLQRQLELLRLAQPLGLQVACFKTSIWDETLYRAWSQMVYSLIPNRDHLQSHLEQLCEVCQADELVLFERATFLVISNVVRRPHADVHRFEKVSNIIKQFKLSCSKSAAHFATMQVRNSHYSALIEGFTSTTYAMVITSDPTTQPATILINIEASRAYFESLIATVSLPKFDFQRST
jgi:Ras-related GTP-binding protein A/B